MGHGTHAIMPTIPLYVPGWHGIGSSVPDVGQYVPTGHDSRCPNRQKKPGGHSPTPNWLTDASGQYMRSEHAWGAVKLSIAITASPVPGAQNEPAGQGIGLRAAWRPDHALHIKREAQPRPTPSPSQRPACRRVVKRCINDGHRVRIREVQASIVETVSTTIGGERRVWAQRHQVRLHPKPCGIV